MSTPNPVPEGHTCSPLAIAGSDVIGYTCHVCGRRWQRHYDETLKEGGPWREVEPGHPIDTETGGYWSGPTLDLVRRHFHHGQTVIAEATVGGPGKPRIHWSLVRDNADRTKYSVYKFWNGPESNWCCTMTVERRTLTEAIFNFQRSTSLAVELEEGR
jgi:hypothetical protein